MNAHEIVERVEKIDWHENVNCENLNKIMSSLEPAASSKEFLHHHRHHIYIYTQKG